VREVGVFGDARFELFGLRGDSYEPLATSVVFPEVDLARIAHYALEEDQNRALRAYRDELRVG
jgi:hypothetical protein